MKLLILLKAVKQLFLAYRVDVKIVAQTRMSLLWFPCHSRSLGAADDTMEGSSKLSSPNQSDKQEPSSVTSPVAKLTIKTETLVRTVVSQTVSTTVVHVSQSFYYCVCNNTLGSLIKQQQWLF